MLGRISAVGTQDNGLFSDTQQLSGQTKQVVKSESEVEKTNSSDLKGEDDETNSSGKDADNKVEVVNLSEDSSDDDEDSSSYEVYETYVAPVCKNKVASFDYNYTKVEITASNYQRELKGENWGTLTSLKLTIRNNEPCTIINPTKIKIKMNPKGKGSVWWDDDLFLPDSFKKILPGSTVSEMVTIHVSYSDVYSEKDFRLTAFDDYGIPMGTFKKYITLP